MPILTIFKPHTPRFGHIAVLIKFPEATPKKQDLIMDNTLIYVDRMTPACHKFHVVLLQSKLSCI